MVGGWWRLAVGGWWSLGAVLKGRPSGKKKWGPEGQPGLLRFVLLLLRPSNLLQLRLLPSSSSSSSRGSVSLLLCRDARLHRVLPVLPVCAPLCPVRYPDIHRHRGIGGVVCVGGGGGTGTAGTPQLCTDPTARQTTPS